MISRMVVDLPAPLGPMNPVTSPGRTVKVRSSTATMRPYRFVRPRTSMVDCMPTRVEIRRARALPATARTSAPASEGRRRRPSPACPAFYRAARRGPARYAVLIALPLLAAVALPVGKTPRVWAAVIFALAATAAALGTLRQAQRRAAQADASVRALQATLAGHQARGERARIARELRDVAAHHISLIALQSDAVAPTSPDLTPQATKLVADIGDAARTALAEMRRIVGVLRADAGHPVGEQRLVLHLVPQWLLLENRRLTKGRPSAGATGKRQVWSPGS